MFVGLLAAPLAWASGLEGRPQVCLVRNTWACWCATRFPPSILTPVDRLRGEHASPRPPAAVGQVPVLCGAAPSGGGLPASGNFGPSALTGALNPWGPALPSPSASGALALVVSAHHCLWPGGTSTLSSLRSCPCLSPQLHDGCCARIRGQLDTALRAAGTLLRPAAPFGVPMHHPTLRAS